MSSKPLESPKRVWPGCCQTSCSSPSRSPPRLYPITVAPRWTVQFSLPVPLFLLHLVMLFTLLPLHATAHVPSSSTAFGRFLLTLWTSAHTSLLLDGGVRHTALAPPMVPQPLPYPGPYYLVVISNSHCVCFLLDCSFLDAANISYSCISTPCHYTLDIIDA